MIGPPQESFTWPEPTPGSGATAAVSSIGAIGPY